MDFPEPLSSMLRKYDWDAYIASHTPIPVDSVQESTVPYLVVKKNTSSCVGKKCAPPTSIKIIGFIFTVNRHSNKIFPNTFVGNNLKFELKFVINETGELSRDISELTLVGSNIYELPSEIREEMLLANSYVLKQYRTMFLTQESYDILQNVISRLIDLNKTDYLKISLYNTTPLITLANLIDEPNASNSILKRIIKYYTLDEIKYANFIGDTALNQANTPQKIKTIKDAIIERESIYKNAMDFPEPLSGMLRNFDWNSYIQTDQPILIDDVRKKAVPYLFTNNTGTIKVVGFIHSHRFFEHTTSISDSLFYLYFVI